MVQRPDDPVLQLLPWRLKPLLPAMYNFMLFQGVWPWTELLLPVQSEFIRASDSQQHIMKKSNGETAVCFDNQAIDNESGKAVAYWIQKEVGLNICKRKDPCFLLICVNCWQLNQESDWGPFSLQCWKDVTHDQSWVADCLLQSSRGCVVLFIYFSITYLLYIGTSEKVKCSFRMQHHHYYSLVRILFLLTYYIECFVFESSVS